MGTLSLTQVARTTFHVEWAMKWVDKCVEDILARPIEWSFREIAATGIRKGRSLAVLDATLRDLGARVQINGKVGLIRIEATAQFSGEERSWFQFNTDMRNSDLSLRKITIEVTADTGESVTYTFTENEIPGYQPCELAAV